MKLLLLCWAGLLAIWTLVQLAFAPHLITLLLLGGAALAVTAFAAVVRLARPSRREAPDLAPAAVLLAFGIAALVSGAELGTWCIALGGLITVAGVAGLVSERAR